jgi:lipopolysaccharide transport system permease protein
MALTPHFLQPAWLLTKQHLYHRYKGSLLGATWLLLQPLLYVALFATVFSQFMVTRFATGAPTHAYVVYLISGLLLWNVFINTVLGMCGVYQQYAAYLKKIPLSLFSLPLFVPLVELVIWAIAMMIFIAIVALVGHPITMTWWWFIPVVLAVVMLAYGIGLILAVTNTFVSDVAPATQALSQVAFWATPIVYVVDILPSWAQMILWFNPMAWAVGLAQEIAVWDRSPSWWPLIGLISLAILILLLAAKILSRSERAVRDLI